MNKNKFILVMLFLLSSLSMTAQKIDFTTYNVVAKAGDVTIVEKSNDYRMVVGSVKKPKATIHLGYSKEQVAQRFSGLLETCNNKDYSKSERQIRFCGVGFHITIKGSGDKEHYTFTKDGEKVSFDLSKSDVLSFKNSLETK